MRRGDFARTMTFRRGADNAARFKPRESRAARRHILESKIAAFTLPR